MKRRSQANVSDDTDDSDTESSDVESSNTLRVPIPAHQSLLQYDSRELDVNHVIDNIQKVMSSEGTSTVNPKLHGITNFYEWCNAWEEHVEALAKRIDPIIEHYHRGLTDFEEHKAPVFDRYKTVNPKKLKKLRPELDIFLRTELQKSTQLPQTKIGDFEDTNYHEQLGSIMSIEDAEPYKLKAAEAYSYRKRKKILNTYYASREHDAVYEHDWVVRVVAENVDVTTFHNDLVAEVFKKVEEENLRESYRQFARDKGTTQNKRRITKRQLLIEDKVRAISMMILHTPNKPGFQRNNERFKKQRQQQERITSVW